MKFRLFLIFLCVANSIVSQVSYVNNYDDLLLINPELNYSVKTHGIFPYLFTDTAVNEYYKEIFPSKNPERKFIVNKLFYEDFYFLRTKDLELRIDPLFEFTKGDDNLTEDYKPYQNTRGILVRGKLGDRLYFVSYALESQRAVPQYIHDYIFNRRVVIPGLARFRYYRTDTLDCSSAGGELFYKVSKNFEVSLGRGKNMTGYGYRTHILSYNPPPMTYLKAYYSAFDGRLAYYSLFALNDDIQVVGSAEKDIFYKGYLDVNYLSYYFTDWLEAGMFESRSFLNAVTAGYFVPVAGWNTLFYPEDSLHKVRFGVTASIRILKTFMAYGQYLPSGGDYQYGLLVSRRTGKFSLFSRAEFNKFEYTHNAVRQQEFFAHLNQNVAYPVEDADNEMIWELTIKYGRIGLYYRYNEIHNYYGANVVTREKRYYRTFEVFAEVNPSYRFQFFGRYILHDEEKWITFGVRTNILGQYLDL